MRAATVPKAVVDDSQIGQANELAKNGDQCAGNLHNLVVTNLEVQRVV